MELIRDLEELQAARKSTRKALRIYGINDINAMMKPLAEMDGDAATKAVLNWVLLTVKRDRTMKYACKALRIKQSIQLSLPTEMEDCLSEILGKRRN